MLNWRTLNIFIGLASLTMLCACGPMYRTDYFYTPPESESGRTCIFQCEMLKGQCRTIEEMRAERCESDSRAQIASCEAYIYMTKGREAEWYECSGSSCSTDYEQCEGQHRYCYQACGGKVDARTTCVANCDQASPAQR